MKTFIKLGLLWVLLAMSSLASATVPVYLGPYSGSNGAVFNLNQLPSDNIYTWTTSLTSGGAFEQTYNFSLGGDSSFFGTGIPLSYSFVVPVPGPGSTTYTSGINNFALALYDSSNPPLPLSLPHPIDVGNYLNAGSYRLVVSGVPIGNLASAYGVSVAVSAIPEPETWAMMLVGVALLGMRLHRKVSDQELLMLSA